MYGLHQKARHLDFIEEKQKKQDKKNRKNHKKIPKKYQMLSKYAQISSFFFLAKQFTFGAKIKGVASKFQECLLLRSASYSFLL